MRTDDASFRELFKAELRWRRDKLLDRVEAHPWLPEFVRRRIRRYRTKLWYRQTLDFFDKARKDRPWPPEGWDEEASSDRYYVYKIDQPPPNVKVCHCGEDDIAPGPPLGTVEHRVSDEDEDA